MHEKGRGMDTDHIGPPLVLVMCTLTAEQRKRIEQRYSVLYADVKPGVATGLPARTAEVRAALTTGAIGLSAAQMDLMPKLELICALGVGYEGVDVAHARQRGIALGNGAGANADVVADHAMALLLAVVRRIRDYDQLAREGRSRIGLEVPMQLAHKRMGIYGMGAIGRKVAQRARGFDMDVAFFTRNAASEPDYRCYPSLQELAEWADCLVVAVPGGADTFHSVDAAVLHALGRQGYLVNIARGSVVDTNALIAALTEGSVGGAGLDVYEGEPEPPSALLGFAQLVLTPHIAGHSPESGTEMVERFLANAAAHFSGTTLPFPIR